MKKTRTTITLDPVAKALADQNPALNVSKLASEAIIKAAGISPKMVIAENDPKNCFVCNKPMAKFMQQFAPNGTLEKSWCKDHTPIRSAQRVTLI